MIQSITGKKKCGLLSSLEAILALHSILFIILAISLGATYNGDLQKKTKLFESLITSCKYTLTMSKQSMGR